VAGVADGFAINRVADAGTTGYAIAALTLAFPSGVFCFAGVFRSIGELSQPTGYRGFYHSVWYLFDRHKPAENTSPRSRRRAQ
jgi:hypothetical protein